MTKNEFLDLMSFPKEWNSLGMYPDELFEWQVTHYQVGHEEAAEHDRNGAFHWWLRRNPTRDQLERLLRLAIIDPDAHLRSDVLRHIRAAAVFDAGLAGIESELLTHDSSGRSQGS
jgi:hypothetical protein